MRWFRWRRHRCDQHTWFWSINDKTHQAIERCWFCDATRAVERMAPGPLRRLRPPRNSTQWPRC